MGRILATARQILAMRGVLALPYPTGCSSAGHGPALGATGRREGRRRPARQFQPVSVGVGKTAALVTAHARGPHQHNDANHRQGADQEPFHERSLLHRGVPGQGFCHRLRSRPRGGSGIPWMTAKSRSKVSSKGQERVCQHAGCGRRTEKICRRPHRVWSVSAGQRHDRAQRNLLSTGFSPSCAQDTPLNPQVIHKGGAWPGWCASWKGLPYRSTPSSDRHIVGARCYECGITDPARSIGRISRKGA
jgi:hypothetical protein